MAWCRSGDKPLSEPMIVTLLTHICVTLPQWVKWLNGPMLTYGVAMPHWVMESELYALNGRQQTKSSNELGFIYKIIQGPPVNIRGNHSTAKMNCGRSTCINNARLFPCLLWYMQGANTGTGTSVQCIHLTDTVKQLHPTTALFIFCHAAIFNNNDVLNQTLANFKYTVITCV